jgi:alpha-glucoside transport system permease protein
MVVLNVLWDLIAVAGVPLVLWGYLFLGERSLRLLRPGARRRVRPWLWVAPAFLLLAFFLVYPALNTISLSVRKATSTRFIGLANYRFIFTGLLMAVLSDRVSYESVAKAVIFLPMAISFVAAGVIWRLMYQFQPAGTAQVGTVNAILTAIDPSFKPQAWLFNRVRPAVCHLSAAEFHRRASRRNDGVRRP